MKYKILFALVFVVFAFFIAFAIKPESKEMVYVYEKSNNLKKLNEEYKKIIDEKPEEELKLLRKVVDNSFKLREDNYVETSIDYYKKDKNYEIIRRIIDGYKARDDYEKALTWLETAYLDFNKIKDLEEIIAISSSLNNRTLLISSLKKLYERENKIKTLFSLYSMGEKDYSLQKLYTLINENKLNETDYVKTLIFTIYEKDFNYAFKLYKNKSLSKLQALENEKEYLFLLQNLEESYEIIDLYKYLYKSTRNDKYYEKLTEMLLYEGEIEEYLAIMKKRYKRKKNIKDLDNIIKYDYLNGNINEYLEYLSEKAIINKDIKTSESIIAYYIDLDEIENLEKFLNKLLNMSDSYDEFKDLTLRSYAYLEMYEKAENILLNYSPNEVSANVVYSVFNRKINEKSMPYFMEVLKESKDRVTKGKLFRYRYKTLRLFTDETYKNFGKPSTFKKLYSYIELFDKKDKKKNLLKFANKSTDPMFISEIAQYFLFDDQKDEAIKLFEKALTFYDKNKLALKTLGVVYLYDNKQDEAFKYFSKLKEIDKNDFQVDYYLAEYYDIKKEKKTSIMYYNNVIKNMKITNARDELMLLRSKAKVTTPMNYKKEFKELIAKSQNDSNLISDIWYLFFQNKNYEYLIEEFKKNEKIIKESERLKDIEINTYLALNKNKLAKEKILKLINTSKDPVFLANLYERLGSIQYQENNKYEALKNYKKSLKLSSTKDKKKFVTELNKEYRTKVHTRIGVRNEIKEYHLSFRHLIKKVKVNISYDKYDEYDSSKVIFTDLNEKLSLGVGKDYLSIGVKKLFDVNLSFFYEKNIDIASKSTIENTLEYDKFSLKYQKSLNENLFYSLNLDYYKYTNFERKRMENSFYIPFYQSYFTSISYVKEDVDKTNIFGYESFDKLILSAGENNEINENFAYFYSLGAEIDKEDSTFFTNFDLYYRNRDNDISIRNSFSKDPLTNDYNFTSMLYYTYYF